MAETEETLNRNWYKAAMGLRYTKDGLQQFVTDEIDKFHKNVLQKLPPNYQCNTCTIQNVLQCPTRGTCGGRTCSFHDNTDPTKQYSSCPNNICGVMRDEVIQIHRYKRPTFKNTDAQVWFNNSWELAKCFMPPGYSDSAAADDTDFSGLIGVILSHLDFQAQITENLNQPGNKFEKVREARNTIMHSPKMELSTIDMNRHFQLLTDVLSDKQHLQTLPKAQEAIKKLKELQQGLITMTATDKEMIRKEYERLKKVTDDGVELIKEKTKESIDNIKKKQIEGIENLMIMANDSCKTLQKETKFGEGCLKRAAAELTSEFERSTHEETKKAKKNIEEEKDVLVEDMKEEAKLQKLEIYNRTQSSIDRIKALQAERVMGPHQMVKDYDEKKKNLQKELIEHYSENGYCLSAIPAQIDDEEVDVADIFDMPKMRIKQKSSKDPGSQKDKYITTISDLFQIDSQSTLRACISGEAGYGKTTFCQKILSNWCKLHTNKQAKGLQSDDQKFLKSFDFLFYIPLRNHTTPDIVEMIKAELVRRDMHDILDEVLRRDSRECFIILDGLDEGHGKEIPIFDAREKMTILVTSRPWKLEVLRPKNKEIGQEIELCGVTSQHDCIMAVVEYLNKIRNGKKTLMDIYEIEQLSHLEHLFKVPSLLIQIVCMGYDDMDFGKTRVEVYCRMIEYYLQMANKRQQDKTKQNRYKVRRLESRKTENDCLLDIFRDLPFCEKYRDLLSRLSDLAFHTLFSEKREDSLVFPHSVKAIRKLDEFDLNFCLKAGLLSQARFFSKVTEKTKKLSFIHKTVQEFFAAVFIAHNDNNFKDMLQRLSCLEDVLEMGEFMRLLSGLRPDMIYDMSKHIADLTDKDEKVTIYRRSLTDSVFEDDDDCDDFYEPHEIESLVYDLVEEGCRWNKGEMVNKVIIRDLFFIYQDTGRRRNYNHLYDCIKGDEVKSFTMEYAEMFEILGKEKVILPPSWWNKFHGATLCKVSFIIQTQADVDHSTHVIQNSLSSLTSLAITEKEIHRPIHLDYQRFFTTFMDTPCLTSICLTCMNFDHSGIEQLGKFLSIRTQLQEIKLENICCVTCVDAPCEYRFDLINHRQLLKLHILYMTGLVTLCEGVPLQCCTVFFCNYGPSFIERLKTSETLQLLRVSDFDQLFGCTTRENDDREASPSSLGMSMILTKVIPTLRNLRQLYLKDIDFGQDLLRLSSDMKYLRIVQLDECIQTLESFKCFINTLPKTQHKLKVNLKISLTSPNDSDESIMAKKYLSKTYHTSEDYLYFSPYKTFENQNHIIIASIHSRRREHMMCL